MIVLTDHVRRGLKELHWSMSQTRPRLKPWAKITKPTEGAEPRLPIVTQSCLSVQDSPRHISARLLRASRCVAPRSPAIAPLVGFGFVAHGFSPGRVCPATQASACGTRIAMERAVTSLTSCPEVSRCALQSSQAIKHYEALSSTDFRRFTANA